MSLPHPLARVGSSSDESSRAGHAPALVALPRRLTSFVGRETLVARVVSRLADPDVRLLTLTGPGGVGKTRLALRVAEVAGSSYPDGVYPVSLAPVVDPILVLSVIGRVVGLTDFGDRPIGEQLADALAGRRLLLVLDNLEQVLAAGPDLGRLLSATRDVAILATSRAPLHIDGEHELAIPPMALPPKRGRGGGSIEETEAVRLFVERARAVQPDFAVTPANAAAVQEIVRRLDGLPLALELAAARTKVLSVESLLLRLERQLYVLTGGPQDRPDRQRTMRDTIAWSYGLLEPRSQALFRRLAVFRGGFSLDDANAVLVGSAGSETTEFDILDGVTALVDQSLLVASASDDGVERFRMLETIREFGLDELDAAGESNDVQARFAARWTALAEATWANSAELDTLSRALAPLALNHDNLRAALDWLEAHDPAGAARLARGLTWFWYLRGHLAEAARRLGRLIALPTHLVPPLDRARILVTAGETAHLQGDTAAALPLLDEALATYRSLGDAWGTGDALRGLGWVAADTGCHGRARALFGEAIELLSLAGDDAGVASARFHLAVAAYCDGDLEGADALLVQALGGPHGPRVRVAGWALHIRGLIAHGRGDAAGALLHQQEALRRFHGADFLSGVPEGLAGVAVSVADAHPGEAVRLWAVAERIAEERGSPLRPPELTVFLASVAELRGRLGEPAFAAAYADGRSLPEDAAVALALELPSLPPVEPRPTGPLAVLSEREREVLRLAANGWTNDRIAEELFLSPRTVTTHMSNIFRKLGVENRTEAVRLATASGMT